MPQAHRGRGGPAECDVLGRGGSQGRWLSSLLREEWALSKSTGAERWGHTPDREEGMHMPRKPCHRISVGGSGWREAGVGEAGAQS